jgi:hypothetical protein
MSVPFPPWSDAADDRLAVAPSASRSGHKGLMSKTDKAKLDAQAVITSVSAPLGITAGDLAIAAASGATPGYLAAADYTLLHQLTTDSGWIAASFFVNWTNFGGDPTVGYKTDALGWVCLKGGATKGTALATPDTIFILPVGFRPATTHRFAVVANGAFGYVAVTTAGQVQVVVGSATWTSLEGIRFDPLT